MPLCKIYYCSGYGFTRTSVTQCSPLPGISLADVCPSGATTYKQSSSGYSHFYIDPLYHSQLMYVRMYSFRQIPGDKCSANGDSAKVLSEQTLPCAGHEQDSGFRVRSVSRLHYIRPWYIQIYNSF